jgi:menaquinone-dependent protoporphyrinogen IX oxidase
MDRCSSMSDVPGPQATLPRRTAPQRILIVYYSRTHTTSWVASSLGAILGADVETLREARGQPETRSYARCATDAIFARRTALVEGAFDAAAYDMVVVGTPVWYASMSSPVRSFLARTSGGLREVAFFVTCGGFLPERALHQMANASERAPKATMTLRRRDWRDGSPVAQVLAFASAITT